MPPGPTLYVVTVDSSASATSIRFPDASKLIANGTPPADLLTTGSGTAGRPLRFIGKTSTVLLPLVVTTRLRPSGVNSTSPGEVSKRGMSSLSRPSERWEPLSGLSPSSVIRNPWTLPRPPAFMTYAILPCTAMLDGNFPPESTTLRSCSRWPSTRNEVTVPLPALTARSIPERSS